MTAEFAVRGRRQRIKGDGYGRLLLSTAHNNQVFSFQAYSTTFKMPRSDPSVAQLSTIKAGTWLIRCNQRRRLNMLPSCQLFKVDSISLRRQDSISSIQRSSSPSCVCLSCIRSEIACPDNAIVIYRNAAGQTRCELVNDPADAGVVDTWITNMRNIMTTHPIPAGY